MTKSRMTSLWTGIGCVGVHDWDATMQPPPKHDILFYCFNCDYFVFTPHVIASLSLFVPTHLQIYRSYSYTLMMAGTYYPDLGTWAHDHILRRQEVLNCRWHLGRRQCPVSCSIFVAYLRRLAQTPSRHTQSAPCFQNTLHSELHEDKCRASALSINRPTGPGMWMAAIRDQIVNYELFINFCILRNSLKSHLLPSPFSVRAAKSRIFRVVTSMIFPIRSERNEWLKIEFLLLCSPLPYFVSYSDL
jgi:hypothetical protein